MGGEIRGVLEGFFQPRYHVSANPPLTHHCSLSTQINYLLVHFCSRLTNLHQGNNDEILYGVELKNKIKNTLQIFLQICSLAMKNSIRKKPTVSFPLVLQKWNIFQISESSLLICQFILSVNWKLELSTKIQFININVWVSNFCSLVSTV